jgi:C-terminal processing protease CtpA/Prc
MTVELSKLRNTRMKLLFGLGMFGFLCSLAASGQRAPCGIGADLAIIHRVEGDRLQILGVASNSPAARAGLAKNQIIRAIDGVPTTGLKYVDCVKRIKGEAGTKVVLDVQDRRHGWTNSIEPEKLG